MSTAKLLLVVSVAAAGFGAGIMGVYFLGRRDGERAVAPPQRVEKPKARPYRLPPAPRTPEELEAAQRAQVLTGAPAARSAALVGLAGSNPKLAQELARDQLRDPGMALAGARVLLQDGPADGRALVEARIGKGDLDAPTRRAMAGMLLEALVSSGDAGAEAYSAKLATDSDPEVRALMARRVNRLGPAAVERLCMPLLGDADPAVQQAAQGALAMAAAERAQRQGRSPR